MNSSISLLKDNLSLSFIVPAMNEEPTLISLFKGIQENVKPHCHSWEIIFIDDGSTDNTWNVMQRLAQQFPENVKAYKFARNRGKADALSLGYKEASGDIVFTMDADLQDDPVEISRFIHKLNEGYDIVSGWKKKRHDPWHKVLPSRIFNAMISKVSGVKLHDHNCGFKAYRKEVVKNIPMYGDMHRMVPSLASFKGYQTSEIEVEHHAREHGVSKYGWGRMIIGAMDMVTVGFLQRFRDCPMHFTGKIAGFLVLASLLSFFTAGTLAALGLSASSLLICGALSLLTALIITTQGLMLEQQVYTRMKEGRNIKVETSINDTRPTEMKLTHINERPYKVS